MMSDESNWQAVDTAWLSQDGESRLYRGDSLEVMSHMPDDSVDCVWTDPPYFLSNDGITCVAGRMVKVNKGEWDRSRGVENDHEFNRTWLSECYRILKPSGTIWATGTLHVYLSVGMAMTQIGFRILNDIIWQKPNPPPNLGRRCFTHSTEMVLWATKARKGSKHRYTFHYDDMREENGGKQMKNVWQFSAAGRDEPDRKGVRGLPGRGPGRPAALQVLRRRRIYEGGPDSKPARRRRHGGCHVQGAQHADAGAPREVARIENAG